MKSRDLRTRQNVYGYILLGLSFFMLTLLTVKLFAPEISTEAESQSASQTVGPYEMSMANDSVATVNITPTDTQSIYSASNDLTVRNTCDAGATITMTMASSSSNALIRTGSDSSTKEISATTSTALDNYTWGYALNNSSTYYAVPKLGETAATVYSATAAQTTDLSVPIKFGVKTNNDLPAGTYTNDVIYTMTPNPGCLIYSVTWDFDGGTAKSGATYPSTLGWGNTINLSQLTPTRDGYTFAGWTNGSLDFAGTETAADLNPSNAKTVTVKAKWTLINYVKSFSYTGSSQTWTTPYNGYYKVELWGASGGNGTGAINGRGLGAYTSGQLLIAKNSIFYIYVGQQGSNTGNLAYNGGGKKTNEATDGDGGGATDIRIISGSWDNGNSMRSRIMVSAAGGGSDDCASHSPAGGSAGGLSAYYNTDAASDVIVDKMTFSPASQTTGGICIYNNTDYGGGLFGMANQDGQQSSAGGGGGWYGGANCDFHSQGGSSYISGHTGSVGVTSTSSSSPKSGCTTGTTNNACSLTPYINPATGTYYTFINTVMIDGAGYAWTNTKGSLQQMPNPSGGYYASGVGHSGNGAARITYLGTSI